MPEIKELLQITSVDLAGKRHSGQPDSPGLSTYEMQQFFDAHPNLNTQVLNANAGIQNDNNSSIISSISELERDLTQVINAGGTTVNEHRADYNNPHMVTKAQLGLGSVDDTSDEQKPLSAAARQALDAKADSVYVQTLLDDRTQQARDSANRAETASVKAQKSAGIAQASAATSEYMADRAAYLLTPASGFFALSVNADGHLIASYQDEQQPPDLCINENGRLILTIA